MLKTSNFYGNIGQVKGMDLFFVRADTRDLSQNLWFTNTRRKRLEEFCLSETVDWLRSLTPHTVIRIDQKALEGIAARIDGYPLAIQIVGSWIHQFGMEHDESFDCFDELLAQDEEPNVESETSTAPCHSDQKAQGIHTALASVLFRGRLSNEQNALLCLMSF